MLWLYLDILGLVTIGVGNLCDPVAAAVKLPMRRPDGSLATPEEIAAEWRFVKAQGGVKDGKPWGLAARHHKYTAAVTKLRITDADIDALVTAKLASNAEHMQSKHFSRLPHWPADAQLVVSSMAWAMGSDFPRKFPTFTKLVNAGQFGAAGTVDPFSKRAACDINPGAGAAANPGVIPRNELNRAHLIAAGSDLARQYPTVLHGPCTLAALRAGWQQAGAIATPPPDAVS